MIHGLVESKNERLDDKLQEFMWNEMDIDSDDLFVHRIHRLGSLYKAKQRKNIDNPKRPIIIAFQDYNNSEDLRCSIYVTGV